MSRIITLILALLLLPAGGNAAEAPKQVGRLVAGAGAVTVHPTADAGTVEALVNLPLAAGSRVATPPRGHAIVEIAAGRFHLDGDSAMAIGTLGPGIAGVALQQG